MKNQFHVFNVGEMPNLDDTDNELLVVLDTNVLLQALRYSPESRKKLYESIKSVKSRLFIPYIVGLEYNFNKRSVIYNLENAEKDFNKRYKKILSDTIQKFNTDFNTLGKMVTSNDENEVREKIKKRFSETINATFNSFLDEDIKEELDLISIDTKSIKKFEKLYEGRVADKLSQEWIDGIEKLGEKRYANNVPPGYMDSDKSDIFNFHDLKYQKKYGDLILWQEIVEKAKEDQIKKVVFISDDLKEDWLFKIDKAEIGVRAELREELWVEANTDLFLLTSNEFLSLSGIAPITKSNLRDENNSENVYRLSDLDNLYTKYTITESNSDRKNIIEEVLDSIKVIKKLIELLRIESSFNLGINTLNDRKSELRQEISKLLSGNYTSIFPPSEYSRLSSILSQLQFLDIFNKNDVTSFSKNALNILYDIEANIKNWIIFEVKD
ncbi:PIN domain-containing protein [Enterococcus faecium]|uniref:PIN domain-containing protein n=2 Tax=Enterococcus TaxID=1350 RepID=UPI0035143196